MNKVFLARCETYSRDEISDIVKKGVKCLYDKVEFSGRTILKPNLLSNTPPEKAVTTHPEFVKGVGMALKDLGAKFDIGDSPGASLKSIEDIWKTTGMEDAAQFLGSNLVNFASLKVSSYNNIKLTNLDKYDFLINLPKMKTHSLMSYTGAVKNLYGLVPGFLKANYHKLAPKSDQFADIVADIYSAIKPDLNILDGVVAMEGRGPQGGNPRKMNLILMSRSAVALDRVMSHIMGVSKKDDYVLNALQRKGVNIPRISDIELIGEDIESFIQSDFRLSDTSKANMLPSWLTKYILKKFLWVYPVVEEKKCTKCTLCQKGCPVSAITVTKERVIIDRKKCISCFCCTELCTYDAFYYDFSYLASKIIKQ